MQCGQLYLLLSLYVLSEGLLLSPSEKAMVCEGEQLELICLTNASFLGWKSSIPLEKGRTHSYSRYIFVTDETDQTSSFGVNSTSFNVSRVTHQDELPLVSRLVINPVSNDLNGTKMNCTDQVENVVNNANLITASTTIYVIGEGWYYNNPPEIFSEEYGADYATIFLKWMGTTHTSYIVSTKPQIIVTFSLSSTQLRVPYNTHVNVSITATFCGQYTTITNFVLYYAKCEYPFQTTLNDSQTVQVTGYVDPSLEGTIVNFSCPIGQVLTGPKISTCLGNGEWEPDSNEGTIKCIVKCVPPMMPSNGFIIVTNDTIEGSSISFICPASDPKTVYTTICNQKGDWEPYPVDICQLTSRDTFMIDAVTLAVVSSISVFIFTSIVFFLFGYICRCRQECRKSARQISENTLPELTTERVDLTRNEAYDIFKIGISHS